MRILLDECVPRSLGRYLGPHHVQTVQSLGWRSRPDGEVLTRAASAFDFFVTRDRSIPAQLGRDRAFPAIVILRGGQGRVQDLVPLLPELLRILKVARPGRIVELNTRLAAPRWIRERAARYGINEIAVRLSRTPARSICAPPAVMSRKIRLLAEQEDRGLSPLPGT